MIYGSEFIYSMAIELHCQSKLKDIGIPTIFYCDIPLKKVPMTYLDEINQKIVDKRNSGGFRIVDKVEAKEIVNCIHPINIYDPILQTTYTYKIR